MKQTVALLLVSLVCLAGCIPGFPKRNGGGQGGDQNSQPPEMLQVDGFWRPSTLSKPLAEKVVERPTDDGPAKARLEVLSLDSDGKSARMVAAWLPPVEGKPLEGSELQTELGTVTDIPFVRLVDFGKREVVNAYSGEEMMYSDAFRNEPNPEEEAPANEQEAYTYCACSNIPGVSDSGGQKPDSVPLFYVDFPAPESNSVAVSFGDNAAFLENISVSQGERFEMPELTSIDFHWMDQTDLSNPYGGGAVAQSRSPINSITESVTDVSVSDRGDTASLNVNADVLFDFDSDKIKSKESKLIESIAQELQRTASGQTVTVEGHTDDEGDEKYNIDLSERRATSVKKAIEPKLKGAGITLKTKGFGESKPILPNRTSSGDPIKKNQAKNRRVSFSYKPKAEINPNVTTGKKIRDLKVMKPGDASDAIASGLVPVPKDSESPEMQLDIKNVEETEKFLRLTFDIRTASGQDVERAFTQGASVHEELAFGLNPVTHFRDTPSMYDVQLWDKESNLLAHSVTAGAIDCLCSRSIRPSDAEKARGEAVEMYAFFPKKGMTSDTLTLRVGGKSQMKFKRNGSASSTAQPSSSSDGQAPSTPGPMTTP